MNIPIPLAHFYEVCLAKQMILFNINTLHCVRLLAEKRNSEKKKNF